MRWVMAVLTALALLTATGAARAQTEEEDSARLHITRGDRLLRAGQPAEALQEFRQAQAIEPLPELEWYVARCHDQLGQNPAAVRHYRAFLGSTPSGPRADEARRRIRLLSVRPRAEAEPADDGDPPTAAAPERQSSDGESAEEAPRLRFPRHTFGFGFGLGGGYTWASTSVGDLSSPGLNLLDIDFFIPVSGSLEVQLWVPLAGIILQNLANGPAFSMDLGLKIYPSGTGAGFFLTPGINVTYVSTSSGSASGYAVGVPLRIGYEFASRSRGFGFSLAGKPQIGVITAEARGSNYYSTQSATGVTYGFFVELGFNFYSTRK